MKNNHIQSKNIKDRHEWTTAKWFLYGPMYGTCFRFNDVVKDVDCSEAAEVPSTARWAYLPDFHSTWWFQSACSNWAFSTHVTQLKCSSETPGGRLYRHTHGATCIVGGRENQNCWEAQSEAVPLRKVSALLACRICAAIFGNLLHKYTYKLYPCMSDCLLPVWPSQTSVLALTVGSIAFICPCHLV